ncbi:outer membrane protein assembly factor BamD [Candidatus Pelagibacter communis]|uniref:outer membrane protein assembly factor BamD n=1 Tax=Pelagibacter ubique TaxID=198252 RepID=UPI00094C8618|nr:outer membrane protein assembly factor BamD [Candidatus Pelagibacter ubique]
MFKKISIIVFYLIIFSACSKNDKEIIYQPLEKNNPYELYKEGLAAFEINDFFFANKKFSDAELNFEQVEFAAKSAIMSIFSLYGLNFYEEATENLDRYFKTYPADKNIIYAHFLQAVIYFEQISDEKKDLKPLLQAEEKINFFLENYPNTEYAIDLKFKKDLIQNQIAAKELYVAKYYISIKKWIPAIQRLKIIINKYDKTIFVEEALHRLVEIHYHLGLENEAKKYANILGYNYNSSQWFEQSYKILNKNYEFTNNKVIKKDDSWYKKIIKKIR